MVELVRLVDRVVFPSDIPSLRRTAKVLVEPSPSQLRAKHAETRGEIRSALLTAAVGGVDLPAAAMDTPHQKAVRQGIPTTGLSAAELIAAATSPEPSDGRDAARTDASGADGLNLAACHACVLLPETSCELNNILLDRALLVGSPELGITGYYSQAHE
ncbi:MULTISPECIES: hypothetical protein [Streptomyces]|uniref:hypothetical protein n=1 Tax=Streptomyces TaxID=1883 RepID=UPI00332843C5